MTNDELPDIVIEHLEGEHEGKIVVDRDAFEEIYERARRTPAPAKPQGNEDARGDFHNAFWEAYKTLDENLRKRFSLHTGRQFANAIFDEFLKGQNK